MKRQSIVLSIILGLIATTLVAQDIEEKHWAFVPPQRPALPALSADQWSRSPIDRFILAELHQENTVLVNGQIALENGTPTGVTAGRVIRSEKG